MSGKKEVNERGEHEFCFSRRAQTGIERGGVWGGFGEVTGFHVKKIENGSYIVVCVFLTHKT